MSIYSLETIMGPLKLCVLMFAYINYQIILGAENNASSLGMGFIITVVGTSILLPIFIYIYQQKLKKQI